MTAPIAVVIPVHNRADLLTETLDSLRAQSQPDWECIVVDDGSQPAEARRIEALTADDHRFRIIHLQKVVGGSEARNTGLHATASPHVVFLDSDDLLHPSALEQRLEAFAERPGLDFLVSPTYVLDTDIHQSTNLYNGVSAMPDLRRFLRRDVPWLSTGPTWRRESLLRIGAWDRNLPSWQDWELHVRALSRGLRYERIAGGASYWRPPTDHGSVGASVNNPDHLAAHLIVIRRLLHDPTPDPADIETWRGLVSITIWTCLRLKLASHGGEAERLWALLLANAPAPVLEFARYWKLCWRFYNTPLLGKMLWRIVPASSDRNLLPVQSPPWKQSAARRTWAAG